MTIRIRGGRELTGETVSDAIRDTYGPTAEDMLARMRERLDAARVDLKQAELRGYSPDFALGRVLALAGLLASCDPALAGDDVFVSRAADVADVEVDYRP